MDSGRSRSVAVSQSGIVVRPVPLLLHGGRRQDDGQRPELLHRPARLDDLLLHVLARHHGGELDPARRVAAEVPGPVVVGAAQGSAQLQVLAGDVGAQSASRGQAHLDVPAVGVHVLQAALQAPPRVVGVAVLLRLVLVPLLHADFPRRPGEVHAVHGVLQPGAAYVVDDPRPLLVVFRLRVPVPDVHGLVEVGIRVDDPESLVHSAPFPPPLCLMSTLCSESTPRCGPSRAGARTRRVEASPAPPAPAPASVDAHCTGA